MHIYDMKAEGDRLQGGKTPARRGRKIEYDAGRGNAIKV